MNEGGGRKGDKLIYEKKGQSKKKCDTETHLLNIFIF